MISVRARLTFKWGVFWTSPIRNPKALAWLKRALRDQRVGCEVFDDVEHSFIADGCFEIAKQNGRGIAEFRWGAGGNPLYCCDLAEMPKATGLLDQQIEAARKRKVAKVPACDEPRELRGPTIDDVAQHTPIVSLVEHGGGHKGKPASADFYEKLAARRVGWIDRLIAWVTGAPKGSEVEK